MCDAVRTMIIKENFQALVKSRFKPMQTAEPIIFNDVTEQCHKGINSSIYLKEHTKKNCTKV